MPLDKSMSHEEMVAELISSYKKTGKIGATEPRDVKHALEIANAVAYNLDENNIAEEVKEMNLEEMLKGLEAYVTSKEKELGIFNEINDELKIDSSLHKGKEAEYYRNNLQGKTVTHPVLGDIQLLGKGKKETLFRSPAKYMGILCYIDKIIQEGYSNGVEDALDHPRNKGSIQGFYYIYDQVEYDGKPAEVKVFICVDNDGKKYYMFNANEIKENLVIPMRLMSKKQSIKENKVSDNSITDNDENVKPGDKFMLGDYIEITILDPKDKSAEKDEALNQKPTVKVTLDNGETFETEVDSNTSEDDLKKQYAVGAEINIGRAGQERKAKITSTTITKPVGECLECNPTDVISMGVPLFLRLLEWAREEATEDVELHDVAEKAIAIMQNGTEFLTMDDYNNIVEMDCCTGVEPPIEDLDVDIIETDMGDMGADPILPVGKKNRIKKLRRKLK